MAKGAAAVRSGGGGGRWLLLLLLPQLLLLLLVLVAVVEDGRGCCCCRCWCAVEVVVSYCWLHILTSHSFVHSPILTVGQRLMANSLYIVVALLLLGGEE